MKIKNFFARDLMSLPQTRDFSNLFFSVPIQEHRHFDKNDDYHRWTQQNMYSFIAAEKQNSKEFHDFANAEVNYRLRLGIISLA